MNENNTKTKKKFFEDDSRYTLDNDSFAHGFNFYKFFWIFMIGCVIGVVVETIYGLIMDGYLQHRQGLIYGPFNPVYGSGAVFLTIALYKLRNKSKILIFLVGAVLGGVFEFSCSVIQEFFTGTTSWDYTGQFGNIGGRTSLYFMAMWGALTLVWFWFILPAMSKLIEKMRGKVCFIITWIAIVFMIFNCFISAFAVYRMMARDQGIPPSNVFTKMLDEWYPDEFMENIYENIHFTHNDE